MRGGFIVVLMSVFVVIVVVASMLVPTIDNISTNDGWDETINTTFNDNPAEILLGRQSTNFALSISVVNDGSDLTITNGGDTMTAAIAPQFILATDSSSVFVNDQNDVVCIWTDSTGTHDMIISGDFTAAIADDKLTVTENGNDTDLPLPAEYLYYPSSTGEYGSFTTGDLTKRPIDPLIAAGSFADVTAYNLNNTRGSDIVQSAIVSPTSITSVSWIGATPEEQNDQLLSLNPDPLVIQPLNPLDPGTPSIVMAAPPTPQYTDGDWGYNLSGSNATIVSYSGSPGNITIPATVGGYSVVAVGAGSYNKQIFDTDTILNSTVTMSPGITKINNYAFQNCAGITSLTIGSSVNNIGQYAFQNCTGLTSITIPSSVLTINAGAFSGCTGLTSITIPSTVTTMASSTFSGCTGLTSVSLSSNLVGLSNYTFQYCTSLTSITIPSGYTTIGGGAFMDCTGLTSIDIPSTVTSISNQSFRGCSSLTSINIDPLNETYVADGGILFNIDRSTLMAYPSVSGHYTVPSTVTSIGNTAFYGCTGLTSIDIPSTVTSIGNSAFYGCTGLTSIDIPSSVTAISQDGFRDCTGLTTFVIPSSITSIGNRAFQGTNIGEVLNLSNVNVTSTSYGLNNADVRTSIDAAAYIAPATLHKTYHHIGLGEFMGEILPILPLIIMAALIIIAAVAVVRRN